VDKEVAKLISKWNISGRLHATVELDVSNKIVGQRGSEIGKNL
jgi:hypothetical protein